MLQPGGDLDLLHEPIGAEGGGEVGAQHLDGHLAVMLEILGEIDGGHAAGPEFALDGVAIREGGGEAACGVSGQSVPAGQA